MLNEILNKIKNIKLKQIIYPLILIIFIAVAIIIFVISAKFLTNNINKAFRIDEEIAKLGLIELNVSGFDLVSKKLTLPPLPPPPPPPSPEPIKELPPPPPMIEDKASLKIAILNSTQTAGLAAGLRNELTKAGFLIEKVGDQKNIEATTLIKVKESKKNSNLINEIKDLVSKKYTPEIQTLEEESLYDLVIIIGKK